MALGYIHLERYNLSIKENYCRTRMGNYYPSPLSGGRTKLFSYILYYIYKFKGRRVDCCAHAACCIVLRDLIFLNKSRSILEKTLEGFPAVLFIPHENLRSQLSLEFFLLKLRKKPPHFNYEFNEISLLAPQARDRGPAIYFTERRRS